MARLLFLILRKYIAVHAYADDFDFLRTQSGAKAFFGCGATHENNFFRLIVDRVSKFHLRFLIRHSSLEMPLPGRDLAEKKRRAKPVRDLRHCISRLPRLPDINYVQVYFLIQSENLFLCRFDIPPTKRVKRRVITNHFYAVNIDAAALEKPEPRRDHSDLVAHPHQRPHLLNEIMVSPEMLTNLLLRAEFVRDYAGVHGL